jgi:hypothetical protein
MLKVVPPRAGYVLESRGGCLHMSSYDCGVIIHRELRTGRGVQEKY